MTTKKLKYTEHTHTEAYAIFLEGWISRDDCDKEIMNVRKNTIDAAVIKRGLRILDREFDAKMRILVRQWNKRKELKEELD